MDKKQFAIVIWEDPDSSSVEVITDENVGEFHKGAEMETAGWILRDDGEGISICSERYFEKSKGRYRGHTFILRPLIRDVIPVKLPSRRKRGKVSSEHPETGKREVEGKAETTEQGSSD